MPIKIDFLADAGRFLRGTDDVEKGLDDVADSLDDVRKDSARMGDAIEDAAKGSENRVERLERSFRELATSAREEGRAAGAGLGDGVKRGTDEASEGAETMKENVGANAKEMAASFDGSVDGMVDGVQGLIAEMTEGFGPAGLAAGVVAAIGIGLAVAAGQEAADALNEAKERAGELALEIFEAGGDIDKVDIGAKIREWSTEIKDNVEWWETWQRSAVSNGEYVRKMAEKTGVSLTDMVGALTGFDRGAGGRVLEELDRQIADLEDTIGEQDNWNIVNALGLSEADGARAELQNLRREVMLAQGVTEEAIEAQDLLAEATAKYSAEAEKAAAIEEARSSAINALQSELDGAVASYGDFLATEEEAADPQAYIDAMQQRIDATVGFSGNVSRLADEFGLSQAEVQAILDQGVDFGPMLQSIIDSGLAPQFVAQIQRAVGGGQEILDGTPLGTTVDVDADLSKVEDKTRDTEEKPRKTRDVEVDANVKPAAERIKGLTSADYKATVDVGAAVSRARREIDSLNGRSVTVTVRTVDERGRRILI